MSDKIVTSEPDRSRTRQLALRVFACAALILGSGVAIACDDRDGDGYFTELVCGTQPDCNDTSLDVHPDAIETCNGVDDDCDGSLDEGCQRTCASWERSLSSAYPDEDPGDQDFPSLALARRGYGLIYWHALPSPHPSGRCSEVRFTRVRDDGSVSSTPLALRASAPSQEAAPNASIAWTGRHFIAAVSIATKDETCNVGTDFEVEVFTLDSSGRDAMQRQRVSCVTGPASAGAFDPRIVWTGDLAVVLWVQTESPARIYAARIDASGALLDPCGTPLFGTQGDTRIDDLRVAWNGSNLGVVWRDQPEGAPVTNTEIYFREWTEELVAVQPEPLRITDSPGYDWTPTLAWSGDGWAISWRREVDLTTFSDIAFVKLTEDGSAVATPPGLVWVTEGADELQRTRFSPDITWSGQEHVIAFREAKTPPDLYLARVDAQGAVLENRERFSLPQVGGISSPSIVWNGHGVAVAYVEPTLEGEVPVVGFQGCGCSDADGDLVSTCLGDCDDSDATVRPGPGQLEVCGDQKDNDCDGLSDCSDRTTCPPLGQMPGAVDGVRFIDETTLAWNSSPDADTYDVSSGSIADLRFEGDVRWSTCFSRAIQETQTDVPDVPPRNDGIYFMVRAWAGSRASCRVGSWGTGERDDVLDACP